MIVDMFAGPGGVDCGARLLGLDDPIGFEWDADACATRAAAGLPTIRCDVTKYRPPENITGLHASPSCVALSMAGHGGGRVVIADLCRAVTDVFDGKHTLARHTRTCARTLRTAGVEALMRTRPKIATDIARLTAINEPATWMDGTIVGGTGSGTFGGGGSVKLTGGGNGAQYPAE